MLNGISAYLSQLLYFAGLKPRIRQAGVMEVCDVTRAESGEFIATCLSERELEILATGYRAARQTRMDMKGVKG